MVSSCSWFVESYAINTSISETGAIGTLNLQASIANLGDNTDFLLREFTLLENNGIEGLGATKPLGGAAIGRVSTDESGK